MMISEAGHSKSRRIPRCLGDYDFDAIARYARKRFVEGLDTVTLLNQAQSAREKEEIALVCLLDVEDDLVRELRLDCRHARECRVTDCRDRLRQLIERDLGSGTVSHKQSSR